MCSHPRPGRAPHTPFSTEFKGGARAVRERLRNLFLGPRRQGRALVLCVAVLALFTGGMVACRTAVRETPPASDTAVPPLMMLPPTAELFGITGVEAALYEAARWAHNPYGWQNGTLALPFVGVYASYEDGNGDTVYLCNLWTRYYYDFLATRGANSGGGGGPAAITVAGDGSSGRFRSVKSAADGEGWTQSIRDLCAPVPGLADQILEGAIAYTLTTPDTDTLLAQYVQTVIGAVDETNVSKEAAADAYLAGLIAAGPGDRLYDAAVSAFGSGAWDHVTYAMEQTESVETRPAYVLRATGEEITEAEYTALNLDVWTGLAEENGFTVGELLDAAAFDAPGQVSAPEGERAARARELFLAHIGQLPACYTSVSTCDAWEVELAFHGQTVGSDRSNHYHFVVSNRRGVWGVEVPLTWDGHNPDSPTGD